MIHMPYYLGHDSVLWTFWQWRWVAARRACCTLIVECVNVQLMR